MKRKALGKGLGSLIPSAPARRPAAAATTSPAASGESLIDLDRVRPNPRQPRQDFDAESLDELAASLKAQGLLQPVIVRPAGDGRYELVAGERRWRAAQRAGMLKIPAIIRNVADEGLLELALIENLQREELNPIEEAQAYRVLIDDLGLTQQQVADRVGRQRATVTNAMRLLQLPGPVQEKVRKGKISMGHARALLGLESAIDQIALAERIASEGLSVRQVEEHVTRSRRSRPPIESAPRSERRDPNVEAAEQALQRALGTKVRIVGKGKRGRIELHYFSDEELDRLYNLVLAAAKGRAARA